LNHVVMHERVGSNSARTFCRNEHERTLFYLLLKVNEIDGRQADTLTADRQTGRQAGRQTARQPDSQTARQPDSQTARQPDSQPDRQTDR
jgi:hypothetical protein